MTIELNVPFSDKKKATKFHHFLKENDCPSHVVKETKFVEKIEYSASVEIFEHYINSFYDKSGDGNRYDDEDAEKLLDWINEIKDFIEKIYRTFELDVTYSFSDDFMTKICTVDSSLYKIRGEDEITMGDIIKKMDLLDKISTAISTISVLRRNNCAIYNNEDKTIILTEKKPVDELILSTTDEQLFEDYDRDDLKRCGIEMRFITSIDYQYVVTAGLEYLNTDSKKIIDFIIQHGVSLENVNEILLKSRSNATFIRRIINLIGENSPSTSELREKLSNPEDGFPIVYRVSERYLEDILTDLKKIGLVKNKTKIAYRKDS